MITAPGYISPSEVLQQIKDLEWDKAQPDSEKEIMTTHKKANQMLGFLFLHLKRASVLTPDGRLVDVDGQMIGGVVTSTPFRHQFFKLHTGTVEPVYSSIMSTARPPDWARRPDKWRWKFSTQMRYMITSHIVIFVCIFLAGGGSFIKAGEGIVNGDLKTYAAILILYLLSYSYWIWKHIKYYRDMFKACGPCLGGYLLFSTEDVKDFLTLHYGDLQSSPPHQESDGNSTTPPHGAENRCAAEIVALQKSRPHGPKVTKEEASNLFSGMVDGTSSFNRAWRDAVTMCPELGRGGRPKAAGSDQKP